MSFGIVAAIGGAALIGGTAYGMNKAGKAANRAQSKADRLQGELEELENKRQDVINPYDEVVDLSSMVSDLSGSLSNPYASLGVATGAAEIAIQESDIALANTLDTLRATGASAGGATALAQAALQSKKGVSASIEQQEAQNEKLRAQGQQNLEQLQMTEAQRVQGALMGEAGRLQQANVSGRTYEFEATEEREMQQLNRKQSMISGAEQQAAQARSDKSGILASGIGAVGSIAGAAIGAKSDRRLKENIKLIGKSSSGLNIYSFEYINKLFGEGTWQGVMSDEIPQRAVERHQDGYDRVDYSKLDVEFKNI